MSGFDLRQAQAWKKKLHVEQFGVSQIRVPTFTDSAKRVENMLSAVDDITEGKGEQLFFVWPPAYA